MTVEDWTLVADWLVGGGTIAAAVVALWLGLGARRAARDESRERRLRETRQIVSIFKPNYEDRPDTIRIINGSSEVINDIWVLPKLGEPVPGHTARWSRSKRVGAYSPVVPFMLPGQMARLRGEFTVNGVREEVEHANVAEVIVVWRDAHGQVWARSDSSEPYPTTYNSVLNDEVPRDLRDIVPRSRWKTYWPDR